MAYEITGYKTSHIQENTYNPFPHNVSKYQVTKETKLFIPS